MFRWAGIGFSQQESYHIGMSLRKLASESPSIESLRLWGKVLGTEGDYYVAEGVLQSLPKVVPQGDGDAANPPVLPTSPEFDIEPRGEGANTFTYWISSGGCVNLHFMECFLEKGSCDIATAVAVVRARNYTGVSNLAPWDVTKV